MKMGFSAASKMFCLTLMLGMVREDSMVVGLAGTGTPDFEAFEDLLKNVSKHRDPGKGVSRSALDYFTTPTCII